MREEDGGGRNGRAATAATDTKHRSVGMRRHQGSEESFMGTSPADCLLPTVIILFVEACKTLRTAPKSRFRAAK